MYFKLSIVEKKIEYTKGDRVITPMFLSPCFDKYHLMLMASLVSSILPLTSHLTLFGRKP